MALFFTVWFNFCSIICLHPVCVSITNMDIDAESGSIVMQIRLHTDDLELVLHNKYHVHGWIGTPDEHQDSRRLLNEYVNERFLITVNDGEKIKLVTDSITIVDEMLWFHMKGDFSKTISQLEVDNRLLTDFFANQTNLIIISTGKKEKWDNLNRYKHKIELSL